MGFPGTYDVFLALVFLLPELVDEEHRLAAECLFSVTGELLVFSFVSFLKKSGSGWSDHLSGAS